MSILYDYIGLTMYQEFLIFSKGMLKIPYLSGFFTQRLKMFSPFVTWKKERTCIVEWGYKASSKKARHFAQQHDLPYATIEDGFLRSIGLGVDGYPPFSLVYDDIGIYYDINQPSRLENLILSQDVLLQEKVDQVEYAIELICTHNLSKYNHAIDTPLQNTKRPIVLVVDQTYGDMAVTFGNADQSDFLHMLERAIIENPTAEIWLKNHPDVMCGKKQGYLTEYQQFPRVKVLSEDFNSISLLKHVDKVYCVTSHTGFEALLLGKTVVTFGAAWFSGWGLTDDRHAYIRQLKQSKRRAKRSLLQLFYAAYFQYCRYINPNTGKSGTLFDVIDYLIQAKKITNQLAGDIYCVGMRFWKRKVVQPFFQFPRCRLHFVLNVHELKRCIHEKSQAKIVVWGHSHIEVVEYAKQQQLPLLRMEDGFLRSVGLGSNLTPPISLVLDDVGIYFDAQSRSRLEDILQHQSFTLKDLQRAETLKKTLIEQHIGKYNVGHTHLCLTHIRQNKLLVVGQVENDTSIQYGSPHIRTNAELLCTVRKNNPQAYIIYKPHPDVVAGNRKNTDRPDDYRQYADFVVEKANILDCINQVDEVHTMTSLAGFEALLREKKVHCYGLPFYSNWGLTVDHLSLNRRSRKLSLLELIAGVLIYYPQYIDPKTKTMIDVQRAVDILIEQRRKIKNNKLHTNYFMNIFMKLKNVYSVLG
ncbi:capsular polysaccharide biosynthesis protein [Pasteurella multocida]|nr:capsular polysaccharide biosynthesis protein [Pasteurella multocida]MDY0595632.1 capsular polysaccharide biosynthesis protein [Pasteurella multocida]MDY0665018.1 capsular polysaccharide biosynthesis protein [Pasteurella multocida]MDY0667102.1 capsular polysaccharide biosynthesis protein [Pasteurella multocida]